jgi:hypothetical protein
MPNLLRAIASSLTSSVERRLFAEYGAIFVTEATPPPTIIFADADAVDTFQSSLAIRRAIIGDYEIALQAAAMDALIRATAEMNDREGQVTARAADSGSRSFADTLSLWSRNVTRGLEHWESQHRLTSERAEQIRQFTPIAQVGVILDMEEREQLFFGTFFDKSILYSVAAPGASQHLALLAFDVAEYQSAAVTDVLGRHGWFRTVPNDLPHFTYLGQREDALPELGLQRIARAYGPQQYSFWIPHLEAWR